MPRHDDYEKRLNELATRLKRTPMTAAQIAKALGCSLPTVHDRLRALRRRGDKLLKKRQRRHKPGPTPIVYGIG